MKEEGPFFKIKTKKGERHAETDESLKRPEGERERKEALLLNLNPK